METLLKFVVVVSPAGLFVYVLPSSHCHAGIREDSVSSQVLNPESYAVVQETGVCVLHT